MHISTQLWIIVLEPHAHSDHVGEIPKPRTILKYELKTYLKLDTNSSLQNINRNELTTAEAKRMTKPEILYPPIPQNVTSKNTTVMAHTNFDARRAHL